MTIFYLSFSNFETLWAFGNTGYRTAVSGSWLVSKKVKSINQHVGRFKSPQSRKPVPFFMIRPIVPFQILYGFHNIIFYLAHIILRVWLPVLLETPLRNILLIACNYKDHWKGYIFDCNSHLPYMDVKTCLFFIIQCVWVASRHKLLTLKIFFKNNCNFLVITTNS